MQAIATWRPDVLWHEACIAEAKVKTSQVKSANMLPRMQRRRQGIEPFGALVRSVGFRLISTQSEVEALCSAELLQAALHIPSSWSAREKVPNSQGAIMDPAVSADLSP